MLQPALIGGAFMGVLSALPIIRMGNACCCLWMIAGGVVAAYLLQQSHPQPIDAGDGALVGLLSGVIGAFVATLLAIPIDLMFGPMQADFLERVMNNASDVPPQFRTFIEGIRAGTRSAVQIVIEFLFTLFLGMIFATIGGLVGAVLFRRKTPPMTTVDILPPQSPVP
jgi:hypothetical protein